PFIGRWIAGLARGELVHHTIAQASPIRGEVPLALAAHYLIGITLTMAFSSLMLVLRPAPAQSVAFAVIFGMATNLLPWFFMFPSMGFGVFGAQGPAELALLRSSFINHLFFTLGLALFTRWLGILAATAQGLG